MNIIRILHCKYYTDYGYQIPKKFEIHVLHGSCYLVQTTSIIDGSINNVAGAHHWFLELLDATPNSKIDVACQKAECVSKEDVTNSQEQKHCCYAFYFINQ